MMSVKLVGFNLVSGDCEESALVYSNLLNFNIIKKNEFHAEIQCGEFILYFNKSSVECKVSPGSLTLKGKIDLETDPFFQLEQDIPGKYQSYLDKYGNRIWLVY